VGGASTLVSCTDHESDAAYEVNGTIADQLKSQAEALEKMTEDLKKLLPTNGTTVEGNINEIIFGKDKDGNPIKWDIAKKEVLDKALSDAKDAATTAKTEAINYTDGKYTELADQILNINNAISQINTAIDQNKTELGALIQANTDAISGLREQMGNKVDQATLDDYADQLIQMMDNYQEGNTTLFNNLTNLYNDMDARLTADENRIKVLEEAGYATKAELDAAVANMNTKIDGKVNTSDYNTTIQQLKDAIAENKTNIANNKTAIENLKAELVNYATKDDLDNTAKDLEKAFKAADTALETKLQGEIDKLQTQLNEMFNAMINMITGIELQATESPVTGYENFSFLGAEAHILGTYYGTAASTEKLGDVDITKGQVLIDEDSKENAGIVYATINPSNKDFTGTTLKVVDSQGNEAPFTATVVKSNKLLKYGISRAADNKSNLYAIKIDLDKNKLDEAKTWTSSDAAALKDVAKNVLDKLRQPSTTRLNLGDAASTIAKTFNNRLTAYALEAEQEVEVNGKKETRTITSKMSLAATAIHPLSYNFLKDNNTLKNLDLPSIPTLQSKINFNDYKFNWTPIEGMGTIKTSITLKNMPDLNSIKIDGEIVVPKPTVTPEVWIIGKDKVTGHIDENNNVILDLSQLSAGATVTIDDIKVNKDNLKVVYNTKDQDYDVEIPMTEFDKIIANINSQVGNMIENVNGIVDKVNGYAETIDGNYITRINNFIQRFENLLRKSNSLLQPAMFYTTSTNSWGQLARVEEGASYLKLKGGEASTILVASSYTGEILAPAYKKMITVDGGATLTAAGKTGSSIVMNGNLHKVGFTAKQAGTYKVTYTAIDYSGVKVSRDFYVKVVK